MKANLRDAYNLLHEGSIVASQIESNGIRIDTAYLERTMTDITAKIERLDTELKSSKVFKTWQRVYGGKTNIGSKEQFANVMFKHLGYEEKKERTETGKIAADKAAFEHIDDPFVKAYREVDSLRQMKNTFLSGIRREVVDGYLHPHINFHIARTYRSSSNSPNFQNIPIRDPILGGLIRRCFVPRLGERYFGEEDLVGAEVRIAACYHKDPTMMKYIKDPTTDMHRDMAAQLFMLTPSQVNKMTRFAAKSFFVFAQFYGDYYVHCAKNLWNSMDQLKLTVTSAEAHESKRGMEFFKERTIREHLVIKGVKSLGACTGDGPPRPGTFENHVKNVEDDFWNRRFQVYTQWKKSWYEKYQRNGYFDMLTGFRVEGYHKRNDVINYPIQGAAFHCLLWSLIQLQKWLVKYKMKTKIVGQIHDSIVSDIHGPEMQDYLDTAKYIITEALPKAWSWISVPLDVEVEIAPVGMSWFDKKEWTIQGDEWKVKV